MCSHREAEDALAAASSLGVMDGARVALESVCRLPQRGGANEHVEVAKVDKELAVWKPQDGS